MSTRQSLERKRMRHKIAEPYLKEKNILQLPVFYFGMANLKKMVTEWEDKNGKYALKYFCDYGIPGSFEQDVYAACMRIWVLQGMSEDGIELNYSDIARALCLDPPKNWTSKIKKALMRLGLARYEFHHCFIEADSEKTDIKQFSLFDTTSFFEHRKGRSKRHSRSRVRFPKEIRDNLDQKYYQWLDMFWYRSLPNGLPRRLYEFLEKRRYHNINGVLTISEEHICRWLPLKDKNTTTRRRTLEKTGQSLIDVGYLAEYSFDKKKKQCSFTYGKSSTKLATEDAQAEDTHFEDVRIVEQDEVDPEIEKQEITPEMQSMYFEALEWISDIPYFRKERRKEIGSLPIATIVRLFGNIKVQYEEMEKNDKAPGAGWIYNAFMEGSEGQRKVETLKESPEINQLELFGADDMIDVEPIKPKPQANCDEFIELLQVKRVSKALKNAINSYYQRYGFEYVKWNILYANKNAKKSYSAYLQKALKENWAESWAEEEMAREAEEKKAKKVLKKNIEKQQQQWELEEKTQQQKEEFRNEVKNLKKAVKEELWKLSEQHVPEDEIGRNMKVRIEYSKRLLDKINQQGNRFDESVISELAFIKEIALKN